MEFMDGGVIVEEAIREMFANQRSARLQKFFAAFSNQGSVKHNVSFPQFGSSKEIPVSSTIEIRNLDKKLGGPGTYMFFREYHTTLGMVRS